MSVSAELHQLVHSPRYEAVQTRARQAGIWSVDALFDALLATAERSPAQVALITGEDSVLTYEELVASAHRFRSYLEASEVTAGDRVAIPIPNSADFVVALAGINAVGATASLIDPSTRGRDLEPALSITEPRLLIGRRRYRDYDYGRLYRPVADRSPQVATVLFDERLPLDAGLAGGRTRSAEDRVTLICFTSGPRAAPAALGIDRSALHRKLRQYGA